MDKSDSRLRTVTYKSIIVLMTFLVAVIFIDTVSTAQSQVFSGILSPLVKNIFLLVLTLTVGAGYILLFRYLNCMEKKGIIISSIVMLAVMLFIYIVLLTYLDPFSWSDAYNVEDYALYLAKTGVHQITSDAPHAGYFGWYPNNYFMTILLSKYMKILLALGVQDMYKPMYYLTAVWMLVTTLFLYLTGVKVAGLRGGARVLAFCVGNPLYYLMIFWVYTNTWSFPFTAGVTYFGIRLFYEDSRKDRIVSSICFAFCAIVGYFIRATVVIPVIAFVLCLLVELIGKKRKLLQSVQSFAIIIVVSVVLTAGISELNQRYFSSVSEENIPVTHWLMMASHGTGKVDMDDFYYTLSFPTKEEKTAATLEKMKENYASFTPAGFIKFLHEKLKVSWGYADGDDLLSRLCKDRENTWLQSWILGDKADLFRMYCYAFRLTNLIFVLAGFYTILKKRKVDVYPIFCIVAFLGGICFYSIWEIKSSYGMPFIMFLLLLGAYGLQCMESEAKAENYDYSGMVFNWKKAVIFGGLLCCVVVSMSQLHQANIVYNDWTVRCTGGSGKGFTKYRKDLHVEQTFYASKPFNQIGVEFKKKGKNNSQQDKITVALKNEKNEEVYSQNVNVSQIKNEKTFFIGIPTVNPEYKKEKYTLTIDTKKLLKDKLAIAIRREYYLGGYYGDLKINDEDKVSRLYLRVFSQTEQPWCSAKAAMAIGAGICGLAGVIILMWPKRKCHMKRA